MSLTGEEEHNRIFLVVDESLETLEIGEEQVCSLVGGEASSETDDEGVRSHVVDGSDDACRVALTLHPVLAELLAYVVDKLTLEVHADTPDGLIRQVFILSPHLGVRLVVYPAFGEGLFVELLPFGSGPSGHVYAVGDIAHMQLFGVVAGPYWCEHLLRHLAVQPAHAVSLLAGVESEHRHRETLVAAGMLTTHVDELLPVDTQLLRVL